MGWPSNRQRLPEPLHPRVATVAIALPRNEYITQGYPTGDHPSQTCGDRP